MTIAAVSFTDFAAAPVYYLTSCQVADGASNMHVGHWNVKKVMFFQFSNLTIDDQTKC